MTTNSQEKLIPKIVDLIIKNLNNSDTVNIQSEFSLQEHLELSNTSAFRKLVSRMLITFDNKNIIFCDRIYELSTNDEDKFNLMLTLTDTEYFKYLVASEVVLRIVLDKTVSANFDSLVSQVSLGLQ